MLRAMSSHEEAMLLVNLLQWGTASGVDDAMAEVFSDGFDPETATASDRSIRPLLGLGEILGTFVKTGALSRELVDEAIWVDGLWARVGPAALKTRAEMGEPRLYENFEALTVRQ
jgi:hypothetical protein